MTEEKFYVLIIPLQKIAWLRIKGSRQVSTFDLSLLTVAVE